MLDRIRTLITNVAKSLRLRTGMVSSGKSARERLQFVLVQDRSALSTETLDAMKNELLDVISKYVSIDRDSIEVEIRRSGDSVMLVSNIPLTSVKRPTQDQPTQPPQTRNQKGSQRRKPKTPAGASGGG